MSVPVPIVECEGCRRRFGLTPQALIEDDLLETVALLCRGCRDGENEFPPEGWGRAPGGHSGA